MKKYKIMYDVVDDYGRIDENDESSKYGKRLLKMSWNSAVAGINIRHFMKKDEDDDEYTVTKGIQLSENETHNLVNKLLELGYGDNDKLVEINNKRNNLFSANNNKEKE